MKSKEWERIYISSGSNLGDREENLKRAFELIGENPEIKITNTSLFYETEPIGDKDQDWFLNGVLEIQTSLLPEELLGILQGIEEGLGRTRGLKGSPRTIDLDILLFGNQVVDLPRLKIPHPELYKRNFVLIPLAEIAPEITHPIFNKTIEELLWECPDTSEVRRWQK